MGLTNAWLVHSLIHAKLECLKLMRAFSRMQEAFLLFVLKRLTEFLAQLAYHVIGCFSTPNGGSEQEIRVIECSGGNSVKVLYGLFNFKVLAIPELKANYFNAIIRSLMWHSLFFNLLDDQNVITKFSSRMNIAGGSPVHQIIKPSAPLF